MLIHSYLLASCQGDSGGPAIVGKDADSTFRDRKFYEQQYIVSDGLTADCAGFNKVGLYARVADRDVLTWIQNVSL